MTVRKITGRKLSDEEGNNDNIDNNESNMYRPSNESNTYRPWNSKEENQIVAELDAKYSMDHFFSEEEATSRCKWDYSVLVSELPSEEKECNKDKDSNNNSKTNKK